MFCEHAAWRRDFRTDDILRWFNDEFHEKDAVRDAYPSFYLRQDRMGRPVYVERLGRLDIKKLTKLTSIDRLVKYHVFEYEALVRYHFPYLQSLRPENDRWDDKSTQSLTIIDLKGVSLSSFRAEARDYLSCITKIDSCNYPELLGNLMVINTPIFFRGVRVSPGRRYTVDGRASPHLRIGFARHDVEELEAAVERLAACREPA